MYKITLLDSSRKLNKEDIITFQNNTGKVMPKDIEEFYLLFNGGIVDNMIYRLDDEQFCINCFFPICTTEECSIEKYLLLLNDNMVFPAWLVPIGDDDSGNLFCYSVKNEELGAIYYYDHEFNYGDDPEKHIQYLCSSLEEFVNSLVNNDEDEDEDDS